MKSKGLIITLIVILYILAISLVGGMILLMNKSYNFDLSFNIEKSNLKLIDSYETTPNSIQKVDFDLTNVDIEVKETTEETFKVEYYSNKKKDINMSEQGNSLIVEDKDKNSVCVGICIEHRKVVLYVPQSYTGIYNLTTKSGDIKFENDIVNNELTIDTTSGDVALENAGNVYIKTVSGDVKAAEIGKSKIKTTSGDVKVKTAIESTEISTVSGDIILGEGTKVSTSTTSGDVDITKISKSINSQTVSGDIIISNLTVVENSSIKTTSGDVRISNNDSTCYVDASSTSGDISIEKSDRKSDLTLTIKTLSGDIIVR